MSESTHPKRVVIVDADNPLQEIHGEFFWREDHDRIVSAERRTAYREGYIQGRNAAAKRDQPMTAVVRPLRGRRPRRVVVRTLVFLAVLAFVIDVLIPTLGRVV